MDAVQEARERYAAMVRDKVHLRSDALVRAFAEVPREAFLGPGPWKVLGSETDAPVHLYDDVLVAIDAKRSIMNGLPSFVAGLIDALDLKAGERVVHVGCGTGYYSAVLATRGGLWWRRNCARDRARACRTIAPQPCASAASASAVRERQHLRPRAGRRDLHQRRCDSCVRYLARQPETRRQTRISAHPVQLGRRDAQSNPERRSLRCQLYLCRRNVSMCGSDRCGGGKAPWRSVGQRRIRSGPLPQERGA